MYRSNEVLTLFSTHFTATFNANFNDFEVYFEVLEQERRSNIVTEGLLER